MLKIHVSFKGNSIWLVYERFCTFDVSFSLQLSAHPPARTTDTAAPEMDVRSASVHIISLAIIAKLVSLFSLASDFVSVLAAAWWLHTCIVTLIHSDILGGLSEMILTLLIKDVNWNPNDISIRFSNYMYYV